MKKATVIVAMAFALVAMLVSMACGGGNGSNNGGGGQQIVVSVNPNTASVQENQQVSFTATVENDSSSKGVTWSLSGGGCTGSACGTLSSATSQSGVSVTYTAPPSVPNPATVTLTATSITDPTKAATATITVTAGTKPSVTLTVDGKTSETVNANQMLSFAWSSANATSVVQSANPAQSNWSGTVTPNVNGSVQFPLATGPVTFTLTASDGAGNSASASVTVTVGDVAPVLNGFNPYGFFCMWGETCEFGMNQLVSGGNFAPGQPIYCTGYPQDWGQTLPPNVEATYFNFLVSVGGEYYRPRFINCQVATADNVLLSNTMAFGFYGDMPIADNETSATPHIFVLDQGDGVVDEFDNTGALTNQCSVTPNSARMRIDLDANGNAKFIVLGSANGVSWTDSSCGSSGQAANITAPVSDVAVKNDVSCGAIPSQGDVACGPVAVGSQNWKTTSAGTTPYSLAMSTAYGGNELFSLDIQGRGQIVLFNDSIAGDGTSTSVGSLTLPEFMPVSQLQGNALRGRYAARRLAPGKLAEVNPAGEKVSGESASLGNYNAVALDSTNLVAVIGPGVDGVHMLVSVIVVNGGAMNEAVVGGVVLPAESFRIAADNVHSGFLIYYATYDASGSDILGTSHIAFLNGSGVLTPLTSASSTAIMAGGGGVLPDGSLYITGWIPSDDVAGVQAVTGLPYALQQ